MYVALTQRVSRALASTGPSNPGTLKKFDLHRRVSTDQACSTPYYILMN